LGQISTLRSRTFALTAAAALGLLTSPAQANEKLDTQIFGARVAQNNATARSQAAIDRMSSETDDMLVKLRQELETIENLEKYNARLRKLIASQEEEKGSFQRQIDGVTNVERGILPLMDQMVASLEQFVARDVPFLMDERNERVANLKDLMEQADVTTAEKYRRLTEAYQIEREYGQTFDAYTATLDDGRSVEFLRFGRVVLIYRTPDGDESKYWDNTARSWRDLDSSYRSAVDDGFKIARKQSAPDLVQLPVVVTPEVQ